MTVSAYVGLGSNVGDRLENLRRAVSALESSEGLRLVRCSAVYDTDPVGPPQPNFLNAVVELHVSVSAEALLDRLKTIEREAGRREREPWGPREVDLDLLLYGTEEIDTPRLRVPHPEMTSRAFVLVPLADVAPFARVGADGPRVVELLDAADRSGVRYAFGPQAVWPQTPGVE